MVSASATNRFTPFAAWFLAILLAFAVGVSRTYRGEHCVTDVLAGALVGVGALCTGAIMIRIAAVRADEIENPEQPSHGAEIEPISQVST